MHLYHDPPTQFPLSTNLAGTCTYTVTSNTQHVCIIHASYFTNWTHACILIVTYHALTIKISTFVVFIVLYFTTNLVNYETYHLLL